VGGDQHAVRRDIHVEATANIGGDRLAQRRNAGGRRVAVMAVAQRLDRRFDDMRRLCDVVYAFPTLIYQLTGCAIDASALSTLENLLPNIEISDDLSNANDDVRPASRAQVKALVNALADERLILRDFGTAFRAERAFQVDALRQTLSGAMTPSAYLGVPGPSTLLHWGWGWALFPLCESDTVELIRWYGSAIDMIRSGKWKDADSLGTWTASLQTPSGSVLHPFTKIMTPSLQASFRIFFRARANRPVRSLQPLNGHVMQKRGEPHLLVPTRHLAHAIQIT
jgi:hypothetical protein